MAVPTILVAPRGRAGGWQDSQRHPVCCAFSIDGQGSTEATWCRKQAMHGASHPLKNFSGLMLPMPGPDRPGNRTQDGMEGIGNGRRQHVTFGLRGTRCRRRCHPGQSPHSRQGEYTDGDEAKTNTYDYEYTSLQVLSELAAACFPLLPLYRQ